MSKFGFLDPLRQAAYTAIENAGHDSSIISQIKAGFPVPEEVHLYAEASGIKDSRDKPNWLLTDEIGECAYNMAAILLGATVAGGKAREKDHMALECVSRLYVALREEAHKEGNAPDLSPNVKVFPGLN